MIMATQHFTWHVCGSHLEIVRLLLGHSAHKNAQQYDGATPLFMAAQNGNTEIVSSLLMIGADDGC